MKKMKWLAPIIAIALTASTMGTLNADAAFLLETFGVESKPVITELPDDVNIKSDILLDGTIKTTVCHEDYVSLITTIAPNGDMMFRQYSGEYALTIDPTSDEEFEAAVAGNYNYAKMDDGNYLVGSCEDLTILGCAESAVVSYWTYDEATAIAAEINELSVAKEISIIQSYVQYSEDGTCFYQHFISTRELTEEDFSALGEDYKVDLTTLDDTFTVSYNGDKTDISPLYEVTKYALTEVDGVYGVCFDAVYYAISENTKQTFDEPKAIFANYITGDPNNDDSVSLNDAALVLDFYANSGSGNEAAFTANGNDIQENAAFTSADIDGDGAITLSDVSTILRYYASTSVGLSASWDNFIS